MEIAPAFFSEEPVLLIASALVTCLCHLICVTPIGSFLTASAIVGPQALGSCIMIDLSSHR